MLIPKDMQKGFTIVELLIVIVVIGILAAITVVAYSGIQQRARDTARKSDLAQLKKAINLYNVDNGNYANIGCGDGGSGWLVADPDYGGPAKSINACLVDGKYIQKPLVDPSGLENCSGLGCYAYLKANCGDSTYLFAHLETIPQTSTDLDSTCVPTWDTGLGANYVLKVN